MSNWPFEHPAASRFSVGRFGCWYGGSDLETTIYETAFHFWQDLDDSDATRDSERVIGYRRVHLVSCSAMLFDLRPVIREAPDVYDHPVDLSPCRALGDEAHRNALPGFLTYSARDPRASRGTVAVVLNPDLLVAVSQCCYLTYRIDTEQKTLTVERTPGETLIQLRRNELKGLNPSAYSG